MQRGLLTLIGALFAALVAAAVVRRVRRSSPDHLGRPTATRLETVPLRGRVPLVLLPASVLAGTVFVLEIAALEVARRGSEAPPTQPIAFDHRIHRQAAGLDCSFCHRAAASGVTAGLPDVQLCMACHQTIGQGQPEIEKVRMAWNHQQSIDWQLVTRMPDHTRFTHDAHIQAGISCSTCHGDVSQMQQVVQVRSLKMADCVACHQQNNAPTECSTCHY